MKITLIIDWEQFKWIFEKVGKKGGSLGERGKAREIDW